MKKIWFIINFFLIGMVIIPDVWAVNPTHADRINSYKGTETCLTCHLKAAKEVASSLHYQQQAEPQFLKDWPKGQLAGMMLSY
jgi:hypothetical protein